MRTFVSGAVLVAVVLALAMPAATAPSNRDELLKDEQHFLAQSKKTYSGGQKAAKMRNMEVVGRNDLGGRGFNADVWVHEGYAYIGHWGFSDWAQGSKTRFCPSPPKNGVAVVDATDPSEPVAVSRLVNPTGTSAEDVTVFEAKYGPLAGRDIAAVGLQVCGGSRLDPSFPRGLMLFDVTNPVSPVQLGFLSTGCCTRGLHELEFGHRDDLRRTFVYASVPASEYEEEGSPSGFRDLLGRGDFRLIDVTNPAAPFAVSDWGVIHDAGDPLNPGQGCDADPIFGHSAEPSADGKLAFVAYWDSGFVALDVTNPASPVLRGHTVYQPDEDGDGHSSMYDDARQLLFSADEDFCKNSGGGIEPGYGYLRIWDYSNLAAPEQIGEYRTPNSGGRLPLGSGDYTIHNPMLMGTDVYISWYSDGVRVVDASDPTNPEEVAFFVPPAGQNPVKPSQRSTLSQTPQVWGVFVDEATGLVYASDMNTGLWILRRTD
ncbi:MAG TPA: hypothetical protein VLA87_04820 [Gaiellaceae bacterium]|nr:hypothetical protein [Gaiellaceae bacterium]